jgi:N-acetylmuramoyl-L-alanine amidase
VVGADGKEIVQTLPFHLGGRHTPRFDESSIAIELQYRGELTQKVLASLKRDQGFQDNQYIYASSLNNSRYGNWPLFPDAQLEALLEVATLLAREYHIMDVVTAEEIAERSLQPGPAFPILQFREAMLRRNLLHAGRRSLVLQETTRDVELLGQPENPGSLLPRIPEGTPVLIVNEWFDWYLIAVMARVRQNPWLTGWVKKEAVKVSTDFIPVVDDNHFLITTEGRRFQQIPPHPNGYQRRLLMEQPHAPRFIIMHYTTGTRMESTINHFKDPGSGVSTHLLIGRDGRVVQFLPFNRIAHHAGLSWWEQIRHLNPLSIGIELDNAGRLRRGKDASGRDIWMSRKVPIPDEHVLLAPHWKNLKRLAAWETFPDVQLEVAFKIVKALTARYPSIQEILGHDDVNLLNREDPGPLFPMSEWRKKLFGRTRPVIKPFYLTGQTRLISNLGGLPPNDSTRLHQPGLLPGEAEVVISGKFDPMSIWTKVTVKQAKKTPTLKGKVGWVRTNSLVFIQAKGQKGGRKMGKDKQRGKKGKKNKPNKPEKTDVKVQVRTKNAQNFFKVGGGEPTPALPFGPFEPGTQVRKQEARGLWTLVVVMDVLNGQTGFEGWVPSNLLSEKRIQKSRALLVASRAGVPLWQHKDDQALRSKAPDRPHVADPAVFMMHESRVEITKQWQFFIRAINYGMKLHHVSQLFGYKKAFTNRHKNDLRADHLQGLNLDRKNPEFDKVRTCALSVMTGTVSGDHLLVQMMNGSEPPPLKPGRTYPERVEEIDPDAYAFTPWTHRHLFFAANITKRGGRKISPFPHGAVYDWTNDGRIYSWMPHVAPAGVKVRYPLSNLVRLEPAAPIPSPYKP